MPVFQRSIKTIQHADDGPGTLGAGQDAEALTWDNATGHFTTSPGGGGGGNIAYTDAANVFERTQTFQGAITDMSLSSEILIDETFPTIENWNDDASGWNVVSGGITHTAGAPGSLHQDISSTDGVHLLVVTVSGMAAGSVSVYDTNNIGAFIASDGVYPVLGGAPGTNTIQIDVSDDFDGKIESVSFKYCADGFPPSFKTITPVDGSESGESRARSGSFFFGLNAGKQSDAPRNTGVGSGVLNTILFASDCTAFGFRAGYNSIASGGFYFGVSAGDGETVDNQIHIGNNGDFISGTQDSGNAATQTLKFHAAICNFADVPTSASGLNPGDLYNDGGFAKFA